MTRYPTEKSVKYFRLVTHAMMKASKRENEYFAIEPYFEEAMKSLPAERQELFYMNFEDRIHDIGIAKGSITSLKTTDTKSTSVERLSICSQKIEKKSRFDASVRHCMKS